MSILDLGKRLLESAKHGDAQEVQLLVTNGAPFTTDWLGASPLHMAAQYGHLMTAEVLLRAGISRDARTKVDRTPLHVAALEGYVEIVELLLKHGAEIEVQDMLYMTPLHWAVERGHIPVINCMLNNNANVEARSKFHKTPMDIAEDNCRMDIVQILQDHLDNPSKKLRVEIQKEGPPNKGPAIQPRPSSAVLPMNVIQSEPLSKFKIKDIITNNMKNRVPNIITATGVPFVAQSSSSKPRPVLLRTNIKTSLPNITSSNSVDDSESSEQKCTNVLATLAALAEATAPNTSVSTQEALKWLEVHGITMLPSDNSTIVASALEGGQTVTLTEAGKMALTWIKEQKNIAATTNSVTAKPSNQNVITLVANNSQLPSIVSSQSSPIIIVNEQDGKVSSDLPTTTKNTAAVEEKEKLLMLELEKMKKQAENYKAQLLLKEHEAEQYRKQLQQLKDLAPQKN